MRTQVILLLAATLVAAPIAGAIASHVPTTTSTPAPDEPVPASAHGADRPPIRIHGDEQFLLPTSGVVNPGAAGDADDPYVIEGWTVRPLHVKRLDSPDDGVGKYCKPSPVVTPAQIRTVRLHAIEIVDTTKHVVIENVTVLPRPDQADGMVDSRHLIGILLRNADHVTIRNVTVGEADGEKVYRGVCVRNSDDLTIQGSTVQRTKNDLVEITGGVGVTLEDNVLANGREGIEALDVDALRIAWNRVIDGAGGVELSAVTDAVVHRNTIWNKSGTGVHLKQNQDGVKPDGVTITDNVVAEQGLDGLRVDSGSDVFAEGNNIHGNGHLALDTDVHVDAWDNWWGDDSGPSGGVEDCNTGETADGQGGRIRVDNGGTVCFDPWLSSPNPDAGA